MALKLASVTRNSTKNTIIINHQDKRSTMINWQGHSKEGREGDIIPYLTLEEGEVKKAVS